MNDVVRATKPERDLAAIGDQGLSSSGDSSTGSADRGMHILIRATRRFSSPTDGAEAIKSVDPAQGGVEISVDTLNKLVGWLS
jgi:hypothetical protein